MNNEVLTVHFVNVKNCFLHLPLQHFRSLIGPTVCGLKLTTNDGRELFFSSSSHPCTVLEENSVGISQTFANTIGINEYEPVIISPLYNLGSLQSIKVTPKSENDYEILHASALKVESSLLNQLRIVCPQQSFPIWVSANISITLVVDSISPNLKYGRLEEYSEVIVDTVLPGNGIKKKISCSNDVPISSSVLKETLIESKRLKFRCVPHNNDIFPKFSFHPYVVLANKSSLPEWARNIIEFNNQAVWRLSKYGNELQSVVVNIAFSEGIIELVQVGGFQTLLVSLVLKNYIGLDLGQKVILKHINSTRLPEITGVLISSSVEEEENLADQVNNTFNHAVSKYGDLLVNTKAPYPLKKVSPLLTIRPLGADWGFVSLKKLPGFSFDVNKYVSNSSAESNQHQQGDTEFNSENFITSYEELLDQGRLALELSLGFHSKHGTKRFSDNVIYTGRSGCGKTWLVKCLFKLLRESPFYIHTEYVSCCSLKGKRVEALSKYLSETLQNCGILEPSVIFLDDIDLLASISEEHTEAAFHTNRISHKVAELIEGYQKKSCIAIVATAKSLENINPQILSKKGKCLFTTVINLPNLSKCDRLELLKRIFTSRFHTAEIINYDYISLQTEGYTPFDLNKLCDKAIFESWQRKAHDEDNPVISNKDIELALKNSKPSSLHQVNFYKGPKICWKDIGGLKTVKEKLVEVVCWSTMYPDIIGQCPVKPQTGVLLYGAPGTGKTLLAGALAVESQMNFISIKGPELMSKYIGESEEGVRKLFERSQAARPCLLFFDEFDSLAPRRGQDQTGVTDRVVNQLLTALDGVTPMSGVWVLAATSRPDLIDPAVLRPGRIGISIHCPLPSKEDRKEIINSICSKIVLSNDINIDDISERTINFTGADIKGLFTSAQIRAIDALQDDKGFLNTESELETNTIPEIELQNDHIIAVLKEMKPSLSVSEMTRYQTIYNQFENHTPVNVQDQKVTHA